MISQDLIRDTVNQFEAAARRRGQSQGHGDGANYSTGWLMHKLRGLISQLPADKCADVLRELSEDTALNLNEAKGLA